MDGIPTGHNLIGVNRWHQVLGWIFSIAIALPGSRGLFNHMQEALCHVEGKRVTLTRGVHQALAEFRWLAEDMGI